MKTLLVFDGNNIFHKNYHTVKKYGTVEESVDMAISESLKDMKYYYERINPTLTMVAFDAKTNWRKEYTKDKTKCYTNQVYKAHRSEKKTKKELEAKKLLDEAIQETAQFLKDNTKLVILWDEGLEADDMASGVCRLFGNTEYDIKIVSSDKDYLQFYRYENVEILNPLAHGKDRNLEDWNNDADLYLFEKCIRGDNKDNVRSSYPRLQRKKLVEAFYDDLKKSNVLNHKFSITVYDEEADEYKEIEFETEKLFEENRMLLDLNAQPEDIRKQIDDVVEREIVRKRKVNFVKFLHFAKQRELNNILARPQTFLPLLKNENQSKF